MLLDPPSGRQDDRLARLVLRDDVVGDRLRSQRIAELRAQGTDRRHVVEADSDGLPQPALPFEAEVHVGEVLPDLPEVVEDGATEPAEDREPVLGVEREKPVAAEDVRAGGAVVGLQRRVSASARSVPGPLVQARPRVVVDGFAGDPEEVAGEPRPVASPPAKKRSAMGTWMSDGP